jgi:hypothetical protein
LSIGNNTQTLQYFNKYIGFKIFHQKKRKEITNYKKPVSSKYIRAILASFVCWKVVSFWKVNSGKVFSDVW